MKKLLALVLVLSMASLANAGLMMKGAGPADVYGVIDITKSSTLIVENIGPAETRQGLWGIGSATIQFGDPTFFIPPAPTAASVLAKDSGVLGLAYDLIVDFNDFSLPQGSALGLGVWAEIPLIGAVAGDEIPVFALNADAEIEAQVGIIEVVPEPITMTLLGLGGLALLRRRHA